MTPRGGKKRDMKFPSKREEKKGANPPDTFEAEVAGKQGATDPKKIKVISKPVAESDGVQVFNNSSFFQWFENHRGNHPEWEKVEVCQTCIKSQKGCGVPIFVTFFAPLNEQYPSDEIKYDHKQMGDDWDLLVRNEDQAFCLKQCLKMAYYISTIHGHEVLMMQAEFFKDENGFIWFYYAHNIYTRKIINKKTMSSEDAKQEAIKLKETKERQRQNMIAELRQFEKQ